MAPKPLPPDQTTPQSTSIGIEEGRGGNGSTPRPAGSSGLRGSDAVQLASALRVAQATGAPGFVGLGDEQLRRTAGRAWRRDVKPRYPQKRR